MITKNRLVMSLFAMFLQISCLNGGEICSHERCYAFSEEEGAKVVLIGNQDVEESHIFQIKVMKEALEKNVVCVQESLSDDEATILNLVKVLGYSKRGYVFGMEDPLVNYFIDLVSDYSVVYSMTVEEDKYKAVWAERAANVKGQALAQLMVDPFAKRLWNLFVASIKNKNYEEDALSEEPYVEPISKETINIINSLIRSKDENKSNVKHRAYLAVSKNPYQWLAFFKYFGLFVLNNYVAKLPEEKRPNIEIIKNYLINPTNSKDIYYIRFDLTARWRDFFITEKIKKAFEFAKTVNKAFICKHWAGSF